MVRRACSPVARAILTHSGNAAECTQYPEHCSCWACRSARRECAQAARTADSRKESANWRPRLVSWGVPNERSPCPEVSSGTIPGPGCLPLGLLLILLSRSEIGQFGRDKLLALAAQRVHAGIDHPAGRAGAVRYAAGSALVQAGWIGWLWLPGPAVCICFALLVAAEVTVHTWTELSGRLHAP